MRRPVTSPPAPRIPNGRISPVPPTRGRNRTSTRRRVAPTCARSLQVSANPAVFDDFRLRKRRSSFPPARAVPLEASTVQPLTGSPVGHDPNASLTSSGAAGSMGGAG